MKKMMAFLFLAAISLMNPMCSGASLECNDEVVYNEYVKPGSFTYRYESELGGKDYIRIEIITDGVKTKKIIKPGQAKKVIVDGKEMWETTPVFLTDSSQVIVYWVDCEYIY